ncbi:MAG TPA: RNase adapter RapZ [Sphingobium sp.]|nr:RNase adapter RapZ [Sphingobium sp.]
MTAPTPKTILLVSGLSGAGKTTALKTLEDMGWEVVDNLPLLLLERLLDTPLPAGHDKVDDRPLALGIDARTRGFDAQAIVQRIKALRTRRGHDVETLFLDCSDMELERRFAETRRRHPLASDRPAAHGLARERELTDPIRRWAEHVIDTTSLTSNGLQQEIRNRFSREGLSAPVLTILSFGFSRGVPLNADLVFDMRFLRNPHWEPDLRPKTGLDAEVAAYVADDPTYEEAVGRIEELLTLLLPRYADSGKSYVTVAFGCTGGRHRSVHVAERVAKYLQDAGFSPTVSHRNMESAPQDSLEKREPGGPKAIS